MWRICPPSRLKYTPCVCRTINQPTKRMVIWMRILQKPGCIWPARSMNINKVMTAHELFLNSQHKQSVPINTVTRARKSKSKTMQTSWSKLKAGLHTKTTNCRYLQVWFFVGGEGCCCVLKRVRDWQIEVDTRLAFSSTIIVTLLCLLEHENGEWQLHMCLPVDQLNSTLIQRMK